AVRAKLDELKKDFPAGIDYMVRYDTTPYIRESIDEVFKTLRDGVLLVALVVLVFLQNWRSALIPLVAVPVAIVGTFAVMLAFGLFGGWFGWRLLVPATTATLTAHQAPRLLVTLSLYLLVLFGAAAGWLVGPPLNRSLGRLFRLFDASFRAATGVYTRMVGM